MDFSRLVDLAGALNAEEAEYILVGGVAVSLQGIARATEDFDLLIRPTIENAERFKQALQRSPPGASASHVAYSTPIHDL